MSEEPQRKKTDNSLKIAIVIGAALIVSVWIAASAYERAHRSPAERLRDLIEE